MAPDNEKLFCRESRLALLDGALGEAEQLYRLVGNLLEMSRMEVGLIRVNKEPCDVQDLIGMVLGQMEERLLPSETSPFWPYSCTLTKTAAR